MPPVKTVKNETAVVVPKAGETYVSEDGTVSQVLDDHIDAAYEPTEEEVLEFADWIGMKLPEDSEYLWLAREGLKTPLPKEWKPCSTNDGEVYYFNFKTGESSWDHPMDSMFRLRFEQEKAKTHKGGKSSATATAAAASSASKAPLSGHGKAGAIPQTRVIMTETGISKREGGGPATASPAATITIDKPRKADKASTHAPQTSSAAQAPPPPAAAAAAASSRTIPFSGSSKAAVLAAQPTAAATALAAPRRIVSEAERAMEERVQRDVQQALEAEKARLADAHAGTIASLQQLHERDTREMRAADEKRRATMTRREDEERERRLQQTRDKCEELYGDELRAMEREEETLKSRLIKMEAEAARAASGNTQRIQVEEQVRVALAKQRADLETTMKAQHEAAMAAEDAAHTTATQKVAKEAQEKISALQQASLRKMDAAERTMAIEVEQQKKELEGQLKEVERRLAEAVATAAATTTTAVAATPAAPSLSETLARISAAKAAQLRDVETEAKKEREAAQAEGEAAVAEAVAVAKQLHPSLSPGGGGLGTPTSRVPSFSGERPMSAVVLGGSFGGSRTTSATSSVAYTQELNRIRMARAKERQDRLAQLRLERDAALAAAAVSPSQSVGTSGRTASSARSEGDSLSPSSLEELKAQHAAELEAKKTLYARLEEELKAQLAREASTAANATTPDQQSALVAAAVDAEMALYAEEVLARHARMQAEADAKREKQLSDHKLALEAYERKKADAEARAAREAQEAQEAFIQENVDAAVAAEMSKEEAAHAMAMTRLAARYEEERGAAKEEVDEEIDAYERAERGKVMAAAAADIAAAEASAAFVPSTTTSPPLLQQTPPPVMKNGNMGDAGAAAAAAASSEARCAQVLQLLSEQAARSEAARTAAEVKRAALEAQRGTLLAQQQHHQQHLSALRKENARLAASLSTAEASRDAARRSASAATPPTAPLPVAASASTGVTPSGHRLRTLHEAGLRALEDGFRAEQAALEADLQSWRAKVRQVLLDKQHQQRRTSSSLPAAQPAPLSTGLTTPRQQVLSRPGSTAASTAAGSTHRTPVLSHASPIALTAAGASLQNTPTSFYPFGDSSWLHRSSSPLKAAVTGPLYPTAPSAAIDLYGCGAAVERSWTAPTTRDAVQYTREHQQHLQQRHLALQAAREAWQQQRSRELQLQHQQRPSLPPPTATSFAQSSFHDLLDCDEDRQRRSFTPHRQPSPRPHPQDQLSVMLTKLSSRLDSLTGQAEQMQQHHRGRSNRMDSSYRTHSAAAGGRATTAMPARPHMSNADHSSSPPPPSVVRKVSHSPHAGRRKSSRQEDNLSSKWQGLLGRRGDRK